MIHLPERLPAPLRRCMEKWAGGGGIGNAGESGPQVRPKQATDFSSDLSVPIFVGGPGSK